MAFNKSPHRTDVCTVVFALRSCTRPLLSARGAPRAGHSGSFTVPKCSGETTLANAEVKLSQHSGRAYCIYAERPTLYPTPPTRSPINPRSPFAVGVPRTVRQTIGKHNRTESKLIIVKLNREITKYACLMGN